MQPSPTLGKKTEIKENLTPLYVRASLPSKIDASVLTATVERQVRLRSAPPHSTSLHFLCSPDSHVVVTVKREITAKTMTLNAQIKSVNKLAERIHEMDESTPEAAVSQVEKVPCHGESHPSCLTAKSDLDAGSQISANGGHVWILG